MKLYNGDDDLGSPMMTIITCIFVAVAVAGQGRTRMSSTTLRKVPRIVWERDAEKEGLRSILKVSGGEREHAEPSPPFLNTTYIPELMADDENVGTLPRVKPVL